jgi:hypothetical protein
MRADLVFDQRLNSTVTINLNNESDEPFVVLGWTGVSQLRKHSSSANNIPLTVTLEDGLMTLICPKINPVSNTAVEPGRYLYDVIFYDINNNEAKILEGIATIKPTVTIR